MYTINYNGVEYLDVRSIKDTGLVDSVSSIFKVIPNDKKIIIVSPEFYLQLTILEGQVSEFIDTVEINPVIVSRSESVEGLSNNQIPDLKQQEIIFCIELNYYKSMGWLKPFRQLINKKR